MEIRYTSVVMVEEDRKMAPKGVPFSEHCSHNFGERRVSFNRKTPTSQDFRKLGFGY